MSRGRSGLVISKTTEKPTLPPNFQACQSSTDLMYFRPANTVNLRWNVVSNARPSNPQSDTRPPRRKGQIRWIPCFE
ncbi:hypothetical protein AVEN_118473-1 [Araneus ventricosus]|uniref:Uncharacterized protein n=1 Tax=Araneus ventricosus TaxID=182803 RepID=A0A4Y1ZMI7_ARAVE|nr:hypothetical protein AVEN_50213-1 [Araneus ventricosus]GBL57869.1 hypothetical protein AVEN_118473-1 [Araneus ventricosus]